MRMRFFKKLFAFIFAVTLLAPSFVLAQSSVSAEYEDYLISVVGEIEEAIQMQDSDRLLQGMTDELQTRIGDSLMESLSPDKDLVEFSFYGYEFSQVDEAHYRVDGKYSTEIRDRSGSWSVTGLNLFFVLEETPDSFVISDTNLHEALSPTLESLIGSSLGLLLIPFALLLLLFIFWIWMLTDVARREIPDKTPWFLLVFLANGLGAIIYFFTARKKYPMSK